MVVPAKSNKAAQKLHSPYKQLIPYCGHTKKGIDLLVPTPGRLLDLMNQGFISLKDIEKLIDQKIEKVSDNPYPQTERPMTEQEKKEFEKEKQRRKQEFFANRKKKSRQPL